MKIKISPYTPKLVIGLIIVLIAGNIFDPIQSDSLYNQIMEKCNLSGITNRIVMFVFMPIMISYLEFLSYLMECLRFSGDNFSVLFCTELMVMGYLGISYYLEKFHIYWHSEEGAFTACIDLLCIENIVIYIFDLIFYFITQIIMKVNISREKWLIVIGIAFIPAVWATVFYMSYLFAGIMISTFIPGCSILLLERLVDPRVEILIFLILWIFFSQVVWRFCSGKVYNSLLRIFSFGHFCLE